jgi:CheY-like chemotaxis protein
MSGSQPTFLYVEDDPLSREVMELLLKQVLGYTQVTTFESSHDFMEKVRALTSIPDVIFLDIQMHPHNGYEMLKMLRGEDAYRKTRIIAMTASVMATDVEALKSAGFDGMIGKPIMRQAFPELLGRILSGESIWFVS